MRISGAERPSPVLAWRGVPWDRQQPQHAARAGPAAPTARQTKSDRPCEHGCETRGQTRTEPPPARPEARQNPGNRPL